MNKNKLISSFLSLPWQPEPKVVSNLQAACNLAVKKLENEFPQLYKRYNWHFTGSNKPVVFGRYGMSNSSAVNSMHVSVFPNFHVDPKRVGLLHASLARSMKSVVPPLSLVAEKKSSILDQMLQDKTPKKAVVLGLMGSLKCYMLTKSGAIFVALGINEDSEMGERFLPEYRYLRQISNLAEEQARKHECVYDWSKMISNTNRLEDGLPEFRYHVTLLLGEVFSHKNKVTRQEFEKVKKIMGSLEVSELLEDVSVELSTLRLKHINGKTLDMKLVSQ